MRIKEVKMYQFEELPKERQDKVLDQYRDINVQDDWYDCVIEDFCDEVEKKGFLVVKKNVEFDLNGQGSGASFSGKVDVLKFIDHIDPSNTTYPRLRTMYKTGDYDIDIIRTSSHYSHAYTMDVSTCNNTNDPEENTDDNVTKLVEDALEGGQYIDKLSELSTIALEVAREEADKLYNTLQKAYHDAVSDEQVKETIILNEMEFQE
jgi:hypothetical protein